MSSPIASADFSSVSPPRTISFAVSSRWEHNTPTGPTTGRHQAADGCKMARRDAADHGTLRLFSRQETGWMEAAKGVVRDWAFSRQRFEDTWRGRSSARHPDKDALVQQFAAVTAPHPRGERDGRRIRYRPRGGTAARVFQPQPEDASQDFAPIDRRAGHRPFRLLQQPVRTEAVAASAGMAEVRRKSGVSSNILARKKEIRCRFIILARKDERHWMTPEDLGTTESPARPSRNRITALE